MTRTTEFGAVDPAGIPGDAPVACDNPACSWRGDLRETVMPLGSPALCPLCREPVEMPDGR